MMKMVTWVSLGLTLLSAVVDLTRSDGGGDDAVEVAMMTKMLFGGSDAVPGQPSPTTTTKH